MHVRHLEALHHHTGAYGSECFVERLRDALGGTHKCLVLLLGETEEVGRLTLGNNEYLPLHGGELVGNGEGVLVFKDNFSGNLTFEDFREDTVDHCGHYSMQGMKDSQDTPEAV